MGESSFVVAFANKESMMDAGTVKSAYSDCCSYTGWIPCGNRVERRGEESAKEASVGSLLLSC
jgi:hypothetical protein